MFTHKNTYMDMSVRAYFESTRIGMTSGNHENTSPVFSGNESILDTGAILYTQRVDNKSVDSNKVFIGYAPERNNQMSEAVRSTMESPQAQPLNMAVNAKTQEIYETTRDETAESREKVGLQAQEDAFAELGIQQGYEKLDSVNIASLSRLLVGLNDSQKDEFRQKIKAYQRTQGFASGKDEREKQRDAKNGLTRFFKKHGYVADGWLGGKESAGMLDFALNYTKNPKIRQIAHGYTMGVDAAAQLRTQKEAKNITNDNLEKFIAGTYTNAEVTSRDLSRALEAYLQSPKHIQDLSRELFGKSVNTRSELVKLFQDQPDKRHNFYKMIRQGTSLIGDNQRDSSFHSGWVDSIVNRRVVHDLMKGNEKGEKLLDEKVESLIQEMEKEMSKNTGMQDVEKYLEAIRNIDREKLKGYILRDVGTTVGANFAKGNMGVGVGKTFATGIEGLTLSPAIGTGEAGHVLGINVRYGGSKDLGIANIKGTEYNIKGSAGVNAGVSTAGTMLFVDMTGSISKRPTSLNGADIAKKTYSGTIIGAEGGGALTFSSLDRRMSNIEEYEELLQDFMLRLSQENWGNTQGDLKAAIQRAATESKAEVSSFSGAIADEFVDYARRNGISRNETNKNKKLVVLQSFAKEKTKELIKDEISNTQDMASFGGGAIGIGHAFGITFPLVGLNWYKIKGGFKKSAVDNVESTHRSVYYTGYERREALRIAQESNLPNELKTESAVNFFLNARGDNTFRQYQTSLTNNNESTARQALIAYVQKYKTQFQKATNMSVDQFKAEIQDGDRLSQILTLTSGSFSSRLLGKKLASVSSPAERQKIISQNAKMVENIRKVAKYAAESQMGVSFDDYYSPTNFKKHLIEGAKGDLHSRNYFGSISYSQNYGTARGLDQLPVDTPLYGIRNASSSEASTLLPKLIAEFATDRPVQFENLKDRLGVDASTLKDLLLGRSITRGNTTIVPPTPQVKLAMSGVVNATCFNGTAFIELGDWTINNKKENIIMEKVGQIQHFDAYQKDYNLLITSVGTKEIKENETTTETGGDPVNDNHTDTQTGGELVDVSHTPVATNPVGNQTTGQTNTQTNSGNTGGDNAWGINN